MYRLTRSAWSPESYTVMSALSFLIGSRGTYRITLLQDNALQQQIRSLSIDSSHFPKQVPRIKVERLSRIGEELHSFISDKSTRGEGEGLTLRPRTRSR
jgi:hypothetical protein